MKNLDILSAGALGDAFGYVVEFETWDTISAKYGPTGLTTLENNPDKPVATDDTQMTLFAVEGIVEAFKEVGVATPSVDDIVQSSCVSFLDWFDTQHAAFGLPVMVELTTSIAHNPLIQKRRAPGNTCLCALEDGGNGTLEKPPNGSKGCGAVMRAAPYALLYQKYSDEEIWEMSARSAVITHGHPDGWISAAALSLIIARVLRGDSLHDAVELAIKKVESIKVETKIFTAELLKKTLVLEFPLHPEKMVKELGEGWTGDEALAISVYAALNTQNVWDAIYVGANHSGDSDSTASIAAQISAAIHGLSHDERVEFNKVDLAPVVLEMVNKLDEVLK